MAAPLVVAAGRTAAGAAGRKTAEGEVSATRSVNRTREQNQNRVLRAKELRRTGSVTRAVRAANDTMPPAANDNEERIDQENLMVAQRRANQLRVLKAQPILGAEEEAENQIIREEKNKPSLLRYSPAFGIAGIKDGLDFTGIGSLPGIGWVVTFFCTILIFIAIIFAKKNGSISDMKFVIKRLLIILVTFLAEAFAFGPNLFPFEVTSVAIVFFMDRNLSAAQIAFLQNITSGLRKKPL